MEAKRTRVTWIRWDKRLMRNVISHPYQWEVVEPDGYARYFDTKQEADLWIADYLVELACINEPR